MKTMSIEYRADGKVVDAYDGYEIYYDKLKIRATNFMFHWALLLAWADLIHRRTGPDGNKAMEAAPVWRLEDYYGKEYRK